eukprot:TRINITY_DN12438_c2_g6_i7.p3 TRINITY_DN12438_c2_g6~~TRINITY_DN12438_c2_g6_i7.p3  ORF type:complete len:100 (-),score=4.60 TRINITY_DN12438_c2_g6_i7:1703-2002(-)
MRATTSYGATVKLFSSFRRGVATSLSASGVPLEQIRAAGRWSATSSVPERHYIAATPAASARINQMVLQSGRVGGHSTWQSGLRRETPHTPATTSENSV